MIDHQLSKDEREVLAAYERGELRGSRNVEGETGPGRDAALNKLKGYTEVRYLLSPSEFETALTMAKERGIPYQVLLTSIARKGLAGMLVDNEEHRAIKATRELYRLHGIDEGGENGGEVVWPTKPVYIYDEEEQEIIDAIERDEMPPPVPNQERERELARQAAYNTLKDHTEVSIWLRPSDVEAARALVKEKEMLISYGTLVSHAIVMYLDGMLIDRKMPEPAAAGARAFQRSRE